MDNKTSAHYQRLYRQRLREQGLVKKEVWILPEHTPRLLAFERKLRQPRLNRTTDPEYTGKSANLIALDQTNSRNPPNTIGLAITTYPERQ